ncbi:hypothetical protein ACFLZC_00835 [Patescibacteria group bacterium]
MIKILNWRTKKQLSIILGALFVVAFAVILIIFSLISNPNCSDEKQNQEEEGVDCGGSCTPCVVDPKEIITLWTRVFRASSNTYDVAALIENPNLFYGLPLLKYTFKIYDAENVLLAIKEGQTFLNPRDKFVIFSSNINTDQREAVRAFVEIEKLSSWAYTEGEKSSIVVSEKNFSNFPSPFLRARLLNQSLFPVNNVLVTVVLYDESENAVAISSTKIDRISAESNKDVTFTWPNSFLIEPTSSKVFTRVDLVK